MSYKVDLNCDLGESFGSYKIGNDEAIIPLVTSTNIACGFHASDPVVMHNTIQMAKDAVVAIGAHPGYLDLMGFGRRNMVLSRIEVKTYVQYQVSALMGMAKAQSVKVAHVKPHGALYNMAAIDYELSVAICEAVKELDDNLIILGLSGSMLIKAASAIGLKYAQEVFADRGYNEDGTLVDRSAEGAFIHDEQEAVARVIKMVKSKMVTAVTGVEIPIVADSICMHGDNDKALQFVQAIKTGLQEAGIKILPLIEVIFN